MSTRGMGNDDRLELQLPATSANLGPGFDAVGLALSLRLTLQARRSERFGIDASGRDAEVCGILHRNLILNTYTDVLRNAGRTVQPLHLDLQNEIPLGMGCGSSAAALLAGVALADHFGQLGWSDAEIVAEASRREGHPDNVAACWYGGFTVSASAGEQVRAVTFAGDPAWRLLLAMQPSSLATSVARALLPASYSRADAVFNVQRTALLVAAFAQGRLDLLREATEDRLHQPYRAQACPLLGALLPRLGKEGIAAGALSGAGPSVLLFLDPGAPVEEISRRLARSLPAGTELLPSRIGEGVRRGGAAIP